MKISMTLWCSDRFMLMSILAHIIHNSIVLQRLRLKHEEKISSQKAASTILDFVTGRSLVFSFMKT